MESKKPTYEEVLENLRAYYGVVDFLSSLREPRPITIKFEGEPGTGKILTGMRNLPEVKMVWEDNPDIPPPPACPVRLRYANCFNVAVDPPPLHPIERLAYSLWTEQYALWHDEYIGGQIGRYSDIGSLMMEYIVARGEALREAGGPIVFFIDEAETILQQEKDH